MAGSGAALEVRIDSAGLEELQERLGRLARALRPAELNDMLESLAAEVESQTRRRISEERTSPNGEAWPPWDPDSRYAKTRHGNQSLLMGEGDLLDSIQSAVDGNAAEIGTNLVYGPIHQFGGTPDMASGPAAVQARPYLGLSGDNIADLDGVLSDLLDGIVGEALA